MQRITTDTETLTKEAIIEIDKILTAGYDVECRKNSHGCTVASVSKQVKYRESDHE